jgi:ribA/ribD-fused uncharacterized protein
VFLKININNNKNTTTMANGNDEHDSTGSAIYFYSRSTRFFELSNFAASPMVVDGKTYATVEHYFQSAKFSDSDPLYAERVRIAATPASAKSLGSSRRHPLCADWDALRVATMRRGLRAKFTQNTAHRDLLVSTGDRILVENAPRDYFWGCGAKRTGRNVLGGLLMELRDELHATS